MTQNVFDVRVARKGQMVIPKPLRERFRIRDNSRVTLIATEASVLIKPPSQKPWAGLRGLLKGKIAAEEIDRLLEEAQQSLFKPAIRSTTHE